jgi:hypothetical protein
MKTRKVMFVLLIMTALLTILGLTRSDVNASTIAVSVQSGGQYMLTSQMTSVAQPSGYRLLDAGPMVDPAPGCCCKSYLPCALK